VDGKRPVEVGDVVEVEVFKITNFGAFVRLPDNRKGLIHISQVADKFVKDINDHLKVGEKVRAKVIMIADDGKIDLSLKEQKEFRSSLPRGKGFKNSAFEGMMKRFLKESQRQQADLKRNILAKQGGSARDRKR